MAGIVRNVCCASDKCTADTDCCTSASYITDELTSDTPVCIRWKDGADTCVNGQCTHHALGCTFSCSLGNEGCP